MAINPLLPPVNYMAMLPQPNIGQAFSELGDILANRKVREQAEIDRQKAEEARIQYAKDLQATLDNPTPEAFGALTAKYPGQREAFKQSWDMMKEGQKEKEFLSGVQAFGAINAGSPQVAAKLLDESIAAKENSGQDASRLKLMRSALDQNPQAVAGQLGLVLSSIDPEKWSKMTTELRAAQKAPHELKEATAAAAIKEAQAKFAPEKFGLEIDLTKSQIDQAKAARRAQDAAAAKSGAEAARARAEADQMADGIIPVEKRPEAEGKFRKEYSDQTKGYQEVKSAYGRVLASEDSAVGDLSLIFGYMKMLDPGSVVREGEFATAQNAAGVPERIQNIYNKVVSGERLSPSQRTSFKGQAGKLYSTAQTQEATVRKGIERIAKGYGLNTGNIFYTPTEEAPQPPAAPAKPGAPVSVTAPNGQVLTFPSQQAADAFKKAAGIR